MSCSKCDRKVKAKGLCDSHYHRLLRGQDLDTPIGLYTVNPPPLCTWEDCQKQHEARGLCTTHYRALLRYGDATHGDLVQCEVCGSNENLHKDHNHACCGGDDRRATCGECVRGTLCHNCNVALGLLKDDEERILALADYIGRWSRSGKRLGGVDLR